MLILIWRPRPESNRGIRICSPLRHHSATWPLNQTAPDNRKLGRIQQHLYLSLHELSHSTSPRAADGFFSGRLLRLKAEQELKGQGRVLLRPSGTEPLIRVMVEGSNAALVQKLTKNIADTVASAV